MEIIVDFMDISEEPNPINGVIFPVEVSLDAVKKFQARVNDEEKISVFGEMRNPAGDMESPYTIDLSRASHFIKKVWVGDNTARARISFLKGSTLEDLYKNGWKPIIIPRIVGFWSPPDGICSSFDIITLDIKNTFEYTSIPNQPELPKFTHDSNAVEYKNEIRYYD